jgi:formate-dependent nitrite reductase membrane component NrfD
MFPRQSRPGIALTLLGVATLFVSVIAQLAVTDGFQEAVWATISLVGAIIIVLGIVVLVRHHARMQPPED